MKQDEAKSGFRSAENEDEIVFENEDEIVSKNKIFLLSRGVFIAVALVGFLVGGLGCPGPDWPKCENDDHCEKRGDKKVNYVCVFGQCQECGRDTDCKDGKKCKRNRCEKLCRRDADCDSGERCQPDGTCKKEDASQKEKQSAKGDACVEDGDCQSGLTCSKGSCLESDDPSLSSSTSSEENKSESATEMEGDCETSVRVHFEFNVFDLTPETRQSLDSVANCMIANSGWRITIEGHADDRGTTQYNLDLGEKRALAVKGYLVRLGVEKSRVRTLSYGEERPLTEQQSESAWSENRRGEIFVRMD